MLFLATGKLCLSKCPGCHGKNQIFRSVQISDGWPWFEMLRLFEKCSAGGRSPIVVGPSQPWRKTKIQWSTWSIVIKIVQNSSYL